MNHRDASFLLSFWRKSAGYLLALCWLLGLLAGIHFGQGTGNSLLPLMCGALSSSVSIVGLVSVFLFPFLCSALAVYCSQRWVLLAVSFAKALSFGYVACLIYSGFGTAGWLAQALLLFFDSCVMALLYWFCQRQLQEGRRPAFDLTVCTALAFAAGCIEFYVISPLVANLS